MKRVLITGADGFIGKNLQLHLAERHDVRVLGFTRQQQLSELPTLLQGVDFVFHLAGINRPQDPQEFTSGNAGLTQALCQALRDAGLRVPVVFASSTQAAQNNAYGQSKRAAEDALFALQRSHGGSDHGVDDGHAVASNSSRLMPVPSGSCAATTKVAPAVCSVAPTGSPSTLEVGSVKTG